MDSIARNLVEIGDRLFSDRGSLLSYWQHVADQFYPERTDFTRTLYLGRELTDHLMESYPVIARRELGNAISTMLRPRAKTWFHPRTGREEIDEIPAVKQWMERAQKTLFRAIYDPKAQFVRATKQTDHDYVAFGNGVISIEEAPSHDHLLYRNWHLRDCAWSEGPTGLVDTMHRKVRMSARNMLAQFGDRCHQTVKTAAEKEPEKKFAVRHVSIPAAQYKAMGGKPAPRGMEWAHVYIDPDHQTVLQETWRHEFGYVVPRWHLISGFQYGFSAATVIALPDARMLQQIARVLMENAEKAIDPPLVATMEAVRSDINIMAGGVTWVDHEYDERLGPAVRPLEINGDVRLGVEIREDIRKIIAEAFFLNKLMVPQGDMTATEVQVRVEEFIRGALPVFEPVEVEYNAPLLSETWDMLFRRGAFGKIDEVPRELHGREFSFVFDSPIQTAEKTRMVAAFQQSAQMLQIAAQFDPKVPKSLDWSKAATDAADGAGAPADWFLDEEALAAEEAAAQQAANMAGMAQLLTAGAGVAGQVADAKMKMDAAGIGLGA